MESWMESRGDKISIFPSMAFREEEREREGEGAVRKPRKPLLLLLLLEVIQVPRVVWTSRNISQVLIRQIGNVDSGT